MTVGFKPVGCVAVVLAGGEIKVAIVAVLGSFRFKPVIVNGQSKDEAVAEEAITLLLLQKRLGETEKNENLFNFPHFVL